MKKLSTLFAKNRAEEFPDDVKNKYILPINYEGYNLLNFSKSSIIIGERGSGKTMFLKYHCYPTIFSNTKDQISIKDFLNIGIYWRPDTDFANLISENYLDDKWRAVFNTYVALSVFIEFSKLLDILCDSKYNDEQFKKSLKEINVPEEILKIFTDDRNIKFIDFYEYCHIYRSRLNDWLNYPEGKPPFVIGAFEKIKLLISLLFSSIKEFENTTFHIFIDEFENLKEEQQKLVNSWIKHSQKPLIFHIAHKKYAVVSRDTESDEQIVPVNDFRVIDLEEMYKNNFSFLAAEIIQSKIGEYFNKTVYNLSDKTYMEKRKEKLYQDEVVKKIQYIFPSLTFKDILNEIFSDSALKKKIIQSIKQGIGSSRYSYEDFFSQEYKEETILNAILLHRKNLSIDIIADAFREKNRFFYKDYINNNLLGAIIYFYNFYGNKVSPYYAGFDRFLILSQYNIRHLLELCHQSLIQYEQEFGRYDKEFIIPTKLQAIAAKRTSKLQIDKVSGLGKYGKDLQRIAIRLGKIFRLSQNRPSQSIAEVNHFVMKGFEINLTKDKDIGMLLNESKVWGILKEETNNKKTGTNDNATNFFILHPIFSVYFGISPRKKRKLDLTFEEMRTIFIEDEQKFKNLYDNFVRKFKLNENQENYNLLDYINEY